MAFVSSASTASSVGLLQFTKGLADLRQKIPVEEARDFLPLRIHDPIDSEVQVRLVEHEQFGQQLFKFFEVRFRHPSDPQFSNTIAQPTEW